ncbi:MAG: hypothetical protein JNM59_10740 [Hyphomonadaceae bacterium]|nr:hypothetical protein [Hyphomonadaceae bacterium]
MVEFAKRREILNGWDVFNARQAMGTVWKDFPVAHLKISSDEFDIDCFSWEGYIFVSEKLREAFGLSPADVQYLEVDSSQSGSLASSKHYKILNVPVVETAELASDEVALRHSLFFHHSSPGQLFCTDALALRVLRAGCTGVRFLELSSLGVSQRQRYRTLRGVEEGGEWDPVRKVVDSTVVEQID